nr:histidine kinase [uncultured Rhodoferax sp.]
MHPALTSPRALTWYLGAWGVAGLLLAWGLVAAGWGAWSNALWFALPVSVSFGFVAPSAYYICRALPVAQRRWLVGLITYAVASAVAATVSWTMAMVWNQFCLTWGVDGVGLVVSTALSTMLWAGSAALFVMTLLVHDIMIAMDQVRQAQLRELQSSALARDTELQLLRAQVNPHFLFNSLNSISALTSIDPATARSMTIALAQYFRQTLALAEHPTIALAQEMAHCQCFLHIEMQRFGAKLQVNLQVDGAAAAARVPPMLLQPLVENAVKHGIANSTCGGTVRVHAAVNGGWLHISVSNPVEPEHDGGSTDPSQRPHKPGLGLGLRTTGQRLQTLYGDQARIAHRTTTQREDETFVVELTLPFQSIEPLAPGNQAT